MPLRTMTVAERKALIAVSRGERAAAKVIAGAKLYNVYTQECIEGWYVAVSGSRVAYVGPSRPRVGEDTEWIEAGGRIVMPGYIEPHTHPFQLYNPSSLAEQAFALGTTTLVCDSMPFYAFLDEEQFVQMIDHYAAPPLKFLWSQPMAPQSLSDEDRHAFAPSRYHATLTHPWVVEGGELTAWQRLLAGEEPLLEKMQLNKQYGKRVEGHLPGASFDTLAAAAAGGVTACHESITAEEVMRRLRLGLYASLRYSSIRPDVPELIRGLLQEKIEWSSRIMLTSDGSTPPFWREGFTDGVIRSAVEAGLDPLIAYRLVTLNPATYFGVEEEVGGIAPGRLADILLLEDLRNPTPLQVMAEGKWVAQEGKSLFSRPLPPALAPAPAIPARWRADEGDFHLLLQGSQLLAEKNEVSFPVIQLYNSVITTLKRERLPCERGRVILPPEFPALYASYIARDGAWVANGLLSGFATGIEGMASSFSGNEGYLVFGREPAAMAQALNWLLEKGDGLVLVERGEVVFYLPLPIRGVASLLPFAQVVQECGRLQELLVDRGYAHDDPFYGMMFLTGIQLPRVRLTAKGVYHLKEGKVLYPARLRRPVAPPGFAAFAGFDGIKRA